MRKQTLTSIIEKNKRVSAGHGYIMQPVSRFNGGIVKWYPDKMKEGLEGGKNQNIL